MPFRRHKCGTNQPLDAGRTGHDDPAPAQFVAQRRGNCEWVGGGERHRQQPFEDLPPLRRQVGEAEGGAYDAELLVTGLEPDGI